MTRFQIKFFEPEAVVFDTVSGDTHYLAQLPLELFRLIQTNPGMSADGTYAALATHMSLEIDPEFIQQTDEALASLRRIGLLDTP
ncbi:HPr-rel-A system PqqD family peptide chaperone [Thiobacillus sp.]